MVSNDLCDHCIHLNCVRAECPGADEGFVLEVERVRARLSGLEVEDALRGGLLGDEAPRRRIDRPRAGSERRSGCRKVQ